MLPQTAFFKVKSYLVFTLTIVTMDFHFLMDHVEHSNLDVSSNLLKEEFTCLYMSVHV